MPTLVNGPESGSGTEPPAAAAPVAPYGDLIAEETRRVRAASDGDARPPRGKARQFSVVAVDEKRATALPQPLVLPPSSTGRGSGGAAFPAETPPLATNHVASNGINGINGHGRTDVTAVPEPTGLAEDGAAGLPTGAAASVTFRQPRLAATAAGRPVSATSCELALPTEAAASSSSRDSSSGSEGLRSSDSSPKPNGGGAAAAAATAFRAAAAQDESTGSLADEQATISGGAQHRIHYRKLREKTVSMPDAELPATSSSGTKVDRLTVPTAASYHHSLPAAGQWNYPALLSATAVAAPRNISTLSLTLLLRDQRRKNLAMLARLFASRQKEKELLDGTGPQSSYQDLMSESKKKRCRVTSMQVAVASLFCILVALVTTSVLLFAPSRNIYRSQPGFVFDKDTRLLTVHNSTGQLLLQIRTGVDLKGLPYNCSTSDDLRSSRRCWKWSPSNVTLRVNVVNLSSELTCVDVTWLTTSVDPVLQDCAALGGMQWYGGTSSRSLPWSLNAALATSAAHADGAGPGGAGPGGAVLYAPGEVVGTLAARAWMSSSGALVAASGYAPLYFKLHGSGASAPAFCLSSWRGTERGGSRTLSYTACVGADVPTVHRRLVESQRTAAAWTSDDGTAGAGTAGTGTSAGTSTPTSADFVAQDGSVHDDASSGTTDAASGPADASSGPADASSGSAATALSSDGVDSDTSAAGQGSAGSAATAATAAASRARWSAAVVRPDPVWIVRAESGAHVLSQVVNHSFPTGTFLVSESALSDPSQAAEAVAAVAHAARVLNVTSALSFGLSVSAFVSVRSELFLDSRYETLWMRTARSSLPGLVREDGSGAFAGGSASASVLVNPSSDLAYELVDQRLREVAGVVTHNDSLSPSSIDLLYLRAAIPAADLDLDAYSPVAQERLLSYPLWCARLGADLVGSLLLDKDGDATAAAAAATFTVLVDGATTGLAGYALSEPVRQGSLADIVTHMLAASVGGDPPSSIGPFAAVEPAPAGGGMDAKSRYIRWMQLAAFAPIMLFDSAPWEHGADVVAAARRVLEYRQTEIVPRLRRLYEAFGRTGEPVYKPLWWSDSVAAAAKPSKLAAQFFLDDLLVAPVVDQKPYRLIYFPTGFWLDQNQKLFIGPGTHNYTVNQDSMPCFLRKTTGIHEKGIPESDVGFRR